jgi:hypothetical protein
MFVFNAFLVPIIWLVNPWEIMSIIRRKLNFGKKEMTQREANLLMEKSKYSMGKRYAEVL